MEELHKGHYCNKGSSSSRISADLCSRSIRQMITLPETNSSPLKIGKRPQKETIVFLCHPFSDVNSLLVSGRLNQQPQRTRSCSGYHGLPVTSHVGIYTLSKLVEQTTPATLEIADANATVSGTFFVDKDEMFLFFGRKVGLELRME